MKAGPPDTPGWTLIGGRSSADSVVGLPSNVWALDWRSTGESVRVTDPLYGTPRTLHVVEVETDKGVVTFAAGEVSNGVFLFALPGIH